MGALMALDDIQLRRLVCSIASIEARPATDRRRLAALHAALETEKAGLLRADPRLRKSPLSALHTGTRGWAPP